MKKFFLLAVALVAFAVSPSAQTIERVTDFNGGKVYITSYERLFGGCEMRLCHIVGVQGMEYAIELDLTDRTQHVCRGNLFTLYFQDNSRLSLANLWDTKADVTQESHVDTQTHLYTDFVPVYDGWYDAFYSVPVTGTYTSSVPVTTTTTFLSLFYPLSEKDVQRIIQHQVVKFSLVLDEETITKNTRRISDIVSILYGACK